MPTIIREPDSVETILGAPATFSVTVIGKIPLTFQWRFNGRPIAGATNSVFMIVSVRAEDAGNYTVQIRNTDGEVTSKDAALKVINLLRMVTQPISQSVFPGSDVTFNVEAVGSEPIKYQWRFNNADISGATNRQLVLKNVDSTNSGVYSAAASNPESAVTSLGALLEVNETVKIIRQPQNQLLVGGARASFNVQASGTPPLRYQWQFNGVDLSGQTNALLEIVNATIANAGQYSVVVANRSGSVQSDKASLIVDVAPVITRQPQSRLILAGETAEFAVGVSGSPPLLFQWRFNGAAISGATNSTILISNVSAAAAGDYTVSVSNAGGSVTSDPATLTVNAAVTITQQPQSPQTAAVGGSATFSVTAAGSPPLSYQWRFNGVEIPGATQPALTLSNVKVTDAGIYQVLVKNPAGSLSSAPAVLNVNAPITIVAQPVGQTTSAGNNVTFNVAAVGTPPLDYQWRFNGADIAGATSSAFTINSAQTSQGGVYSVVIRNVVGSVISDNAALRVIVPPGIQTPPASQNVPLGNNVTFTVAATGDAPLSYQWLKNGQKIDAANASNLTLSNVQAGDAGTYSVVVENAGGTATSQSASLAVNLPPLQGGRTSDQAPPPVEAREGSFDGGNNLAAGGAIARKNTAPTAGEDRWFSWKAPVSGIVTFNTRGSTFDTLLAIYTGTPPNNLALLASDDDSGGFFTSEIQFNAVQGTTYYVNVKGFGGSGGRIVVTFKLEETAQQLPVLVTGPQSQLVARGANVTLNVVAQGTALTYQWFTNGVALLNATNPTLALSNVQDKDAVDYTVRVTSGAGAQAVAIDSLPARIQIGNTATLTEDKFKNAPRLGGGSPARASLTGNAVKASGGSVARGYSGSQVFNTYGSTKEQGEPNHADVVGGASQWFTYLAPDSGVLRVSTEGSDFDTVLGIYSGPGTDFASLKVEAFDNNSGADGITSVASASVTKGSVYYIAVDGVKGITGTVKLSYDLAQAPAISRQPASQSVIVGASAAFFVEVTNTLSGASTTPTVSYQWLRDGLKLAGETNRALTIQKAGAADAADYTVLVSNFAGAVTSAAARLTVNTPLTIATPPESQTVKLGERASFQVVVSGTEPVTYQWRLNGTDIAGATQSTYIINSATANHAGTYTVVAVNAAGSVQSAPATLAVNQVPAITTQPNDQLAVIGTRAVFAVAATGTAPLSYQWQFNGVNIAGATNATFDIASVGPASGGRYVATVSNAAGSVTSSSATLTVGVPLALAEQPQSQTVTAGSAAVFSARAVGSGAITYQWRKGGVALANANGQSLALSNVQAGDAGDYSVLVTSGAESVTSVAATLAVSAPPAITEQPRSQTGFIGADVTFRVVATGTAPLNYQWYYNGKALAGATNSILTLIKVEANVAGNYAVVVANNAGSAVSDVALLTVSKVVSNAQRALGGFQFQLRVPEGKKATVQSSADLQNWTSVTASPVTGTIDVQDTQASSSELRFYRVLME